MLISFVFSILYFCVASYFYGRFVVEKRLKKYRQKKGKEHEKKMKDIIDGLPDLDQYREEEARLLEEEEKESET